MSDVTIKTQTQIDPIMPKGKGMRVIEMGTFPMDKIISSKLGTNSNRPEGVSIAKVEQHEYSIRNGLYRPEYFVPPVIELAGGDYGPECDGEWYYKVTSGGHRHMAHENTGRTTFYAALVEFYDDDGRSANYWRKIYQSNENGPEDGTVSKNYRKDPNVMSTTLSLIDSGDIQPTAEAIQSSLEDQGFGRSTNKGVTLLNKILMALGHVEGVTRIYSDDDLANVVTTETTPTTKVMVRKMKDKSGIDTDFDTRLMRNIVKSLSDEENSKQYINVFMHWTGLSPSQVITAREVKDKYLEKQYRYAKAIVEAYESGELNRRVQIRYLPQLNGEYDVEEILAKAA